MAYLSATDMVIDARNRKYAVGHFNLNNMEFMRAFSLTAVNGQWKIHFWVFCLTTNSLIKSGRKTA